MDIRFWGPPNFVDQNWLACGISRRTGGSSLPPYDSLNLKHHTGDHPISIIDNRRLVSEALGFVPESMVCAEQVHGGKVAVVTEAERGRGAIYPSQAIPGVDSLVTNTPNLLLTLFFADCLPILFADPAHRAIGVAHAGWRGLVGGVIEKTLDEMQTVFGTEAADVLTAVGPGIGQCCFEVGPEVAAQFPAEMVLPGDIGINPRVDLKADAIRRLALAGIAADHIAVCADCTSCLPERWYSHRRDQGKTGRMGAFIGIHPSG